MSSSPFRRYAFALVVLTVSTMAPAGAASAQSSSFTFTGRGWGHGVGMSQWGARGLADAGWSTSRILAHYYSGTSLHPKPAPPEIRVGLLQERTEILIEGNGRFDLHDRAGALRASGKAGERWRVVPSGNRLAVYPPGSSSAAFTSGVPVTVRYEQHGAAVKLPQTGYSYSRGRMDVDINANTGRARVILMVGFEQYLYGLGEMPASWHMEALKAQAIAGRTYALEKINRLGQNRSVCNCALYATTADQAYVGVAHEAARWVNAVNATARTVVTHGGEPIQAFYSASTGGFTEHNEHVWGGSPIPYLRGTCDPGDNHPGNPNGNWAVKMSATEVSNRMRDAGHNIGQVREVRYLDPRGVSGRLLAVQSSNAGGVRVVGALGSVRLSGSAFRSIMGLRSTLIHHRIYGGIRARYDALGCAPGIPRTEEYTWRDLSGTSRGRAQDFVRGRLFWNAQNSRVFWTYGGILARYDSLRAQGHDLGVPTTDERGVPGGRVSQFERGHLYWSSRTGTRVTYGGILAKYLAVGGPATWGLPTTDELGVQGGRTSHFEKARVYWSGGRGAHVIYGGILQKYIEVGAEGSGLGLPTSDEYSIPGGRRSDFERGYITWNASTGATDFRITG